MTSTIISDPPDTTAPGPRRKHKVLRVVLSVVLVLLLIAGGTAYWALDRYVIDHVEIADVAAYEAAVLASTEEATSTATETAATAGGDNATATTATVDGAAVGGAPTTETILTPGTYLTDTTAISITEYTTGTGNATVTYYVADVVVSDATQVRSAFANNQYGTNITADTSVIAEANDAVFAINGDYYGFRRTGILIRNGVVYRDDGARIGLAIYRDGTMEIYDETTTTGAELVEAGVWNTLSFGPALVDGGEIVAGIETIEIDTNFGNHSIQGNQPRTGIGMIDENHFVFVVVDGRSPGYSNGVTMTEFALIFQGLGAEVAYNLDGGGSATMYFNGELVNNPLGRGNERATSDIIYIGW